MRQIGATLQNTKLPEHNWSSFVGPVLHAHCLMRVPGGVTAHVPSALAFRVSEEALEPLWFHVYITPRMLRGGSDGPTRQVQPAP